MCLVGNKRAEIAARVLLCENNFCTEFAHQLHFCGLQKLNTLNLCLFHPPLNPRNHFSTVLIKTNWYTLSYKYQDCSGLTSITIPAGVTNIGDYAFEGLTYIYCEDETPSTVGTNIVSNNSIIFVPDNVVDAYQSA